MQMWESLNSGEAHQWAKAHFYFEQKMALDLEKIRAICDRVATSLGLELVDVEFRGGAGKQGRLLRITIDKPATVAVPGANTTASDGSAAANLAETSSPTPSPEVVEDVPEGVEGVSLEDCANVSREVGTILDVEDPIPGGEYLLEVSSPGLDRKLSKPDDFRRFMGSRVKLMTHDPIGVSETSKGNRHFEGKLENFDGGRLTLDLSTAKAKSKLRSKSKQKQKEETGNKVTIDLANIERANLVPEI
jgi:ribosome maturation factor RimP